MGHKPQKSKIIVLIFLTTDSVHPVAFVSMLSSSGIEYNKPDETFDICLKSDRKLMLDVLNRRTVRHKKSMVVCVDCELADDCIAACF